MGSQHDFGSDVEIWDFIGFGYEWRCPGGAGIGFNHIDFLFGAAFGQADSKLDVDESFDLECKSNLSCQSSAPRPRTTSAWRG